jgi:hypothetical protein
MSEEKAAPAEGRTCTHAALTQPEPLVVVAVPLRASTLAQIEALRAQPRPVEASRETLLRALIAIGLAHWTSPPSSETDAGFAVTAPSRGDAR